jgi:hypothetical protein
MKITRQELAFVLTLPRRLEADEVSDLAVVCSNQVELIGVDMLHGEEDPTMPEFMHTFGLTAEFSKLCATEMAEGAYIAVARERARNFVAGLPDRV